MGWTLLIWQCTLLLAVRAARNRNERTVQHFQSTFKILFYFSDWTLIHMLQSCQYSSSTSTLLHIESAKSFVLADTWSGCLALLHQAFCGLIPIDLCLVTALTFIYLSPEVDNFKQLYLQHAFLTSRTYSDIPFLQGYFRQTHKYATW